MTTILQISDPHLLSHPNGTLKGVPTADSFRLVLRRAREEFPSPDRVVLSGDLTHEHTVAGYELLSGWDLPEPLLRFGWRTGHLPLQPIWPGFTVNALFYAAALWLLTLGSFQLRRGLAADREERTSRRQDQPAHAASVSG